jgi:hypothetical protein
LNEQKRDQKAQWKTKEGEIMKLNIIKRRIPSVTSTEYPIV